MLRQLSVVFIAIICMLPNIRAEELFLPAPIKQSESVEISSRKSAVLTLGDQAHPSAEVFIALLKALQDKNWQVRSIAACGVGKQGGTVVPKLLRLLISKDESARIGGALALAEVGAEAAPAVTILGGMVRGDSWEARCAAIAALNRIGPGAREAVPALIDILKGSNLSLRMLAADALGSIGSNDNSAQAALLEALDDSSPELKVRLLRALTHSVIWTPAGVDRVALQLAVKNDRVRETAADLLGALGDIAVPAVTALVTGLGEENPEVRRACAVALGKIGPLAAPAVPALRRIVFGAPWVALESAAWDALARIGPAAVPDLLDILAQSDYRRQIPARAALIRIASAYPPAAFLTGLKSNKEEIRVATARLLGQIQPARQEIVLALVEACDDKVNEVRLAAADALKNLDVDALAAVVGMLSDERPRLRSQGAMILAKSSAISNELVPLLMPLLNDSHMDVKLQTVNAFGEIGAGAAPAVLKLLNMLDDSRLDPDMQTAICRALEHIGGLNADAFKPISKLLTSKTVSVRAAAAPALACIRGKTNEAVVALVNLLATDEVPVKVASARGLGLLGEDAKMVAAPLYTALASKDEEVREAVIAILPKILPAETAVSKLIPLLKDKDSRVRSSAVRALGFSAQTAALGSLALTETLRDSDEQIRKEVIATMAKAGPQGGKALVLGLADENPSIRARTIIALKAIGPPTRDLLPDLLQIVKSGKYRSQEAALTQIRLIRPYEPSMVPDLLEALRSPNTVDEMRRQIVMFLGEMESAADKAVPELIQELRTNSWKVRYNAAIALGQIGNTAGPALKALLNDPSPDVQRAAAKAFETMGSKGIATIPEMLTALRSKDTEIQERAINALVSNGAKGADAVMPMLDNPDKLIRQKAYIVLCRIGKECFPQAQKIADHLWLPDGPLVMDVLTAIGPETLPVVLEKLKDPSENCRKRAALLIGRLGDASGEVIPALIRLLGDENGDVQLAAISTLGRLGDASAPAVEKLDAVLNTQGNATVRLAILKSFETIGSKAAFALATHLGDADAQVRAQCLKSLIHLGSRASDALPQLHAILIDRNSAYRQQAISILGSIGSKASSELLSLLELCDDPDRSVVDAAQLAIGNIGAARTEALPILITMARTATGNKQLQAIQILGATGVQASSAVPTLLPLLKAEQKLSDAARSAIRSISIAEPEKKDFLLQALNDPNWKVKSTAAMLLQNMKASEVGELAMIQNEVKTVEKLHEYVSAQEIYFNARKSSGAGAFATQLSGDDSLYEKKAGSKDRRYISSELADAEGTGDQAIKGGYRYRIIKSGPPGTEWFIKGLLKNGHALIAYPEKPGETGKLTFIISDQNKIFASDFGLHTLEVVSKIASFETGPDWTPLKE